MFFKLRLMRSFLFKAWGLAMAAYAERTPYLTFGRLLLKSLFGAFILRSSACTVNDIFDRKFDAAVGE